MVIDRIDECPRDAGSVVSYHGPIWRWLENERRWGCFIAHLQLNRNDYVRVSLRARSSDVSAMHTMDSANRGRNSGRSMHVQRHR